MKVGIWGATSAGKTTYIGSLKTVTLYRKGTWRVDGDDDEHHPGSQAFIDRLTDQLAAWELPSATERDAKYAFILSQKSSRMFRGGRDEFRLIVDDRRGSVFKTDVPTSDQLWADLASCDGLILLFDPEREEKARIARRRAAEVATNGPMSSQRPLSPFDLLEDDDEEDPLHGNDSSLSEPEESGKSNFHYVHHIGARLQAMPDKRKRKDGYLPHFLAVCITKFDQQSIFTQLNANGFVEPLPEEDGKYAPNVTPRVPARFARDAFELLADRKTINTLEDYFAPARTKYFVVSATGLYLPDGETRIDPGDTSNVIGQRTRSEVRPVGVFEPVQWLMSQKK